MIFTQTDLFYVTSVVFQKNGILNGHFFDLKKSELIG